MQWLIMSKTADLARTSCCHQVFKLFSSFVSYFLSPQNHIQTLFHLTYPLLIPHQNLLADHTVHPRKQSAENVLLLEEEAAQCKPARCFIRHRHSDPKPSPCTAGCKGECCSTAASARYRFVSRSYQHLPRTTAIHHFVFPYFVLLMPGFQKFTRKTQFKSPEWFF
jgi:muramidase (phage lysozyme)